MKASILSCLPLFFYCSLSCGQTMDWVSLPQEVNGSVNCLTVYKGELISGGFFSMAGTTSANKIAAWDGTDWDSLGIGLSGGSNPFVIETTVFDDALYVVGNFDSAGTVVANDIAKWDGFSWSALGTGSNKAIYSIAAYNNEIYVGGIFDSIGGISANHIAKWNGVNWQALSSGIQGNTVNDLYVFKNELYVVGVFNSAGNIPCNSVARWNGNSWNNVSTSLGYGNSTMIEWDSTLLIGTELHLVWGTPYLFTYQWDGNDLTVFSQQKMFQIRAFAHVKGKLYCSGGGGATAPPGASLVSVWEDSVWTTVGTGVNDYIQGLCEYNGDLYCGGFFNTDRGANHNYIARLSNTVGIDDILDDNISVNIFPNPSSKEFTIETNSFLRSEKILFEVFDLTGRKVFTERLFNARTTISDFNNQGLFFWKLDKNGQTIKTGKLLVE